MSTLTTIRNDYIRRFRPHSRAEAAHFALGSTVERVRKAALARTASGRKHKHQWRIPPALLAKFAERLVSRVEEIPQVRSFAELLGLVGSVKLKGISDLTVYDTSVRIGVGQRIKPEHVYLHAGTRKGAAQLGMNVKRSSIPPAELPPEFAGLSPAEVEDLLCIYAAYFGTNAKKFTPTRCDANDFMGCRTNSRACA